MADKETGGAEAAEADGAREDAGTEGEVQQEVQQDEPEAVTALASEMGWKPKDQFGGDPSDWKPASEFIKAGREINRSLSKELRGVKDEVSRLSRTSAQIMEDTLKTRLAERDDYWKRIHADAVAKDDPVLAERAVDERLKIASERSKAPTADSGLPPETAAFMERNRAWFGTATGDGRFMGGDPLARMRAMEICDALAKQGVPPDEQLQQAERAVRKEFPDLFPKPAKPPAGVQTGQSRSSGGGSRAKGYADMPAESQKLAKDYLDRHGIPLEDFAKKYWQQQDERKVG